MKILKRTKSFYLEMVLKMSSAALLRYRSRPLQLLPHALQRRFLRSHKAQSKFNLIASFLLLLSLTSCQYSYTRLEFERGRKASEEKEFNKAIKHFYRVLTRDPESNLAIVSAIKAAQISQREIKDYKKSVFFYKHVVRYSNEKNIVQKVQKKIADLYFENIGDYQSSINEYSKLISTSEKNSELYIDSKFKIAKSYFYLNNFFQAQVEVKNLIKEISETSRVFELKQFLANIYFTTKKIKNAIEIFEELNKDFPDRSREENIPMSIVVCYEELKQFDEAIEKLKAMKNTYPTPEFIDFKINRLKERKENLPRRR